MSSPPANKKSTWTSEEAATELLPQLLRILQARGLPTSSTTYDFAPLEDELGCPLPADYKALIQAIPPQTSWGLDPFTLYTPPEIVKCMQELRGVYCADDSNMEAGVELQWKDQDKCFVPFGTSASAFYLGWIKSTTNPDNEKNDDDEEEGDADDNDREKEDKTDHGEKEKDKYDGDENKDDNVEKSKTVFWRVVQLDGESELEPNLETVDLSLVELLYRMVVRAVTTDLWNCHEDTCAKYFWHSEMESQDVGRGQTTYARDGSQDHAASDASQIVVFGRPVVVIGTPDDDEEDPPDDLQRGNFTDGASEEDFLGAGAYNVTHPNDATMEAKKEEIKQAEHQRAMIDTTGSPARWFDDDVVKQISPDLLEPLQRMAVVAQRIAVGEIGAALIAKDGSLAVTEQYYENLMWWCDAANRQLAEKQEQRGSAFTQVALAVNLGIALTDQGHILQWSCEKSDQGNDLALHWVELPDTGGTKVSKICAGQAAAVAILEDGCLLYWGDLTTYHGERPDGCSDCDPFIVPDIQNVVDVSIEGVNMCVLHSNGTVTQSSSHSGLITVELLPNVKIVAVAQGGYHLLMVATDGSVYGMGNRNDGQLPLAVTNESLAAYEEAKQKYISDLTNFESELEKFRMVVVEHCESSCPKSKDEGESPPTKKQKDVWSGGPSYFGTISDPLEARRETIMTKMMMLYDVNGVDCSPEACGSPAMPAALENQPVLHGPEVTKNGGPPSSVSDAGLALIEKPQKLTVGPEHGQKIKTSATLTKPKAWNSVTGPYGLEPGSFAPVVGVAAGFSSSVFLHADRSLSACGEGSGLALGIGAPDEGSDEGESTGEQEEENNDENEEEHETLKNIEQGGEEKEKSEESTTNQQEEQPKKQEQDDPDDEQTGMEESDNEEEDENENESHNGIVGCQVRNGGFVSVYDNLAIPAKVVLDEGDEGGPVSVICVVACSNGGVAIAEDGCVWSCGDSMGTEEPTATYTPLKVLTHKTQS